MEKKRNLWVIPTDKPSRLHKYDFDGFALSKEALNWKEAKNIYITNSEEIKEEDWVYDKILNSIFKFESGEANDDYIVKNIKKIILTTDQDLIKDGVQTIPDEFLEWFVKNPSCEVVEVDESPITSDPKGYKSFYKIIIPKEEPNQDIIMELQKDPLLKDFDNQVNKKISFLKQKQETLEEVAKSHAIYELENNYKPTKESFKLACKRNFIRGAKWQQENSNINALHFEIDSLKREIKVFKHQQEQEKNKYSEEDLDAFRKFMIQEQNFSKSCLDVFVEQFKKK